MTRPTSILSFNTIVENGLLSKMKLQVYSALYEHGPATALELYTRCFKETHRDHSITPRFSELERMGVVRNVRERICTQSGSLAIEWETTDKLPAKLEKPHREKCKTCNGKGYIQTQQVRFDI